MKCSTIKAQLTKHFYILFSIDYTRPRGHNKLRHCSKNTILVHYSHIRYQNCISRPHPKTKFSQNSLFPKENPQHLGLICKRNMRSAVTVVLCPWTNQSLAWHAHQRGHHATTTCTSSFSHEKKVTEVLLRSFRMSWQTADLSRSRLSHCRPHSPRAMQDQSCPTQPGRAALLQLCPCWAGKRLEAIS